MSPRACILARPHSFRSHAESKIGIRCEGTCEVYVQGAEAFSFRIAGPGAFQEAEVLADKLLESAVALVVSMASPQVQLLELRKLGLACCDRTDDCWVMKSNPLALATNQCGEPPIGALDAGRSTSPGAPSGSRLDVDCAQRKF